MVDFDGYNIYMTRGDSAVFEIVIYTPRERIYELQDGDQIKFVFYKDKRSEKHPVIEKVVEDNRLELAPNDTEYLLKGGYKYKGTLVRADGFVDTFCKGNFYLT